MEASACCGKTIGNSAMDNKDFSDILNDSKDLTVRQILRILLKIKYRTATMIILFVVAALGSAFAAGKVSHQKSTAVMLESPFSMRIELGGTQYDFENLTLMRDPASPTLKNKVVLSIREIKSAFDIIPVGKMVATTEEAKISGMWKLIISQNGSIITEA